MEGVGPVVRFWRAALERTSAFWYTSVLKHAFTVTPTHSACSEKVSYERGDPVARMRGCGQGTAVIGKGTAVILHGAVFPD